jgi:hypothetical protein
MAKSDKLELSRLYLGFARECLNAAVRAKHPEEAEQLGQMCRCFISEAEEALNSVDAVPSSG